MSNKLFMFMSHVFKSGDSAGVFHQLIWFCDMKVFSCSTVGMAWIVLICNTLQN